MPVHSQCVLSTPFHAEPYRYGVSCRRSLFGLCVYIKSEIISILNTFWVYLFRRDILFVCECHFGKFACNGRQGTGGHMNGTLPLEQR